MSRKNGSLHVIMTHMFGGKTTFAIHLLQTHQRACNSIYINHDMDTRSNAPFSSHNMFLTSEQVSKLNAKMMKVKRLCDIDEKIILDHSIIIVDEFNFFNTTSDKKDNSKEVVLGDVECIIRWVDVFHKDVWVFGLNGDSERNQFGRIADLIPHADEVTMLRNSICDFCAELRMTSTAIFSYCVEQKSEQIAVGSNQYRAVCRACYLAKQTKKMKD